MGGRKVPNSSEEAVADSVVPQRFAFGAFILDMQHGALTCEGRRVAIGHKGLLLLHALVRAPTQVVSKSALMDAAWPAAIV